MPSLTKLVLTVEDTQVGPILRELSGRYASAEFHHIEIRDGRNKPRDTAASIRREQVRVGTQGAISEFLKNGRPVTVAQIAESLGLSGHQVSNAMYALKQKKAVKHNKKTGTWSALK